MNYIWLYVSIICYLLMSLSFLLMPADFFLDEKKADLCVRIAGISFWIFLLLGIATQVILFVRLRKNQPQSSRKQRIGLLSFFQNIGGIIADSVTVLSFVGVVISMLVTDSRGYICYVFLSLFVFSFCMHCVLNGKTFYHITKNIK